ncbi:MAG: hypothetical protein RLZZ234_288 [Candidatus Parcubacteria bacterium]|jgi:hypothetical protein
MKIVHGTIAAVFVMVSAMMLAVTPAAAGMSCKGGSVYSETHNRCVQDRIEKKLGAAKAGPKRALVKSECPVYEVEEVREDARCDKVFAACKKEARARGGEMTAECKDRCAACRVKKKFYDLVYKFCTGRSR